MLALSLTESLIRTCYLDRIQFINSMRYQLCGSLNRTGIATVVEMAKVPKNILKLSAEEKRDFIDSFDLVLNDCDGVCVLYSSSVELMPINAIANISRRSLDPHWQHARD